MQFAKVLQSLVELNIEHNKVNDEGTDELFLAELRSIVSIRSLRLANNKVSPTVIEKINKILNEHSQIEEKRELRSIENNIYKMYWNQLKLDKVKNEVKKVQEEYQEVKKKLDGKKDDLRNITDNEKERRKVIQAEIEDKKNILDSHRLQSTLEKEEFKKLEVTLNEEYVD